MSYAVTVQSIIAITLAVQEMPRSVDFYQGKVGLTMLYGGPDADFTSFQVGQGYLNLILTPNREMGWWGRVILHVDDVDALHRKLLESGVEPATTPQDAPWRERYFHVIDPDGHELSFAKPLAE